MKIGMLPLRVKDDIKLVPSGLMYIASYLEKYSGFNDICMRLDARNLIEQKPDVVAIGSVTQTFTEATRTAREIKEYLPGTKVIVGGPHISAMPHTLPSCFDAGVMGEGEHTMLDLLNVIEAGDFNPEKLKEIDGVVFHDEQGNNIVNRRREWLDPLDLIPPPKRELIGNLEEKLQQTLLTARGCSFKCRYCASTQFWEKIRFHSAERVVEEIIHIIDNYPRQTNITINDDLFTANVRRLRTIVGLIREAGIHKKVTFVCNSRASVFSEEVCELLMKMNVNYIIFGLESGSDKILSYLKGSTKAIKNHQAVNICRKFGIASHGNFIFGSPVEDQYDAAQSYWFARSMKDTAMTYSIAPATPYPGTSFWEYITEKKIIDKETFTDWHELSLDWNPNRFFFMNENYSKQEFIDMMGELMLLKVDKKIVDISLKFNNYKSRIAYYKLIYEKLFEKINQNPEIKNILEISVARPAAEPDSVLREDINRVKVQAESGYCDYTSAISKSGLEEFDTILFMHSLETIRDTGKLLTELSALKGVKRIITVSYNVKHISMLIDLLSGDWITYKSGIDNEARFNHYDPKSLGLLLEKYGFSVVETDKNLSKVEQHADIYKMLLQLFGQTSNIKNYIFESDTASFILTAEKKA